MEKFKRQEDIIVDLSLRGWGWPVGKHDAYLCRLSQACPLRSENAAFCIRHGLYFAQPAYYPGLLVYAVKVFSYRVLE